MVEAIVVAYGRGGGDVAVVVGSLLLLEHHKDCGLLEYVSFDLLYLHEESPGALLQCS